MRYELTDHEWTAIKPFLPNKPRGVPRVNDHRVLNGIFWVLRSGALGVTYLRRSVPTPLDRVQPRSPNTQGSLPTTRNLGSNFPSISEG